MSSLAGIRIIVTGGASGMGAVMVEGYARAGAQVAAFYRNQNGQAVLERLAPDVASRVSFLRCDVASKEQVDAAVAQAVRWMGGLDVLVNSAGIAPGSPAECIELQSWDEVFAINARGTFLTNQAAFPYLKDRGGKIINFASSTGAVGRPGKAHYAASKGAVLAWTRSVAREWGRYGITVNAIAPAIWTAMYEKTRATMSREQLAAHDAERAQIIPLGGKLGDPLRDFLPYMIFLAGEGSGFITGQTIVIDGGAVMLS
jgi:NAD(P)-dependent dehydrogenase (short-subunit alcohol dehydrogenase family)